MITIITPTYNRAYTLPRLYNSLHRQKGKFEWIVVDDGSSDNTAQLVQTWQKEAAFPIYYIYRANGGKHRAINTGVQKANGDWVFIVDSDDFLTDDAIEKITSEIMQVDSDTVGLAFRRADHRGNIIGREFKNNPKKMVMTPTEAGHILRGDLAYIFRIDVFKKHPFPEIAGEKFVPELLVWNAIAKEGKIIYFPSFALYITEYLPDGYTVNFKKNLRANPKGFGLFYRKQIFEEEKIVYKLKNFLRWMQCIWYRVIGK